MGENKIKVTTLSVSSLKGYVGFVVHVFDGFEFYTDYYMTECIKTGLMHCRGNHR